MGSWGPCRAVSCCLALGAAALRPHLLLSPQFLLTGRWEPWETVLVNYPLGDGLSRSLPLSGSQFPLQYNQVPSTLLVPPCVALADTDF